MPATQSQSTQVKPPKWPGRGWVMRYEALPGCCRQCDVALIVARVPWSALNLPGPRDAAMPAYSGPRKPGLRYAPTHFQLHGGFRLTQRIPDYSMPRTKKGHCEVQRQSTG